MKTLDEVSALPLEYPGWMLARMGANSAGGCAAVVGRIWLQMKEKGSLLGALLYWPRCWIKRRSCCRNRRISCCWD